MDVPQLSRLEVENFKSYAGLHVLGPFTSPFTCIIGPNGAGNIYIIYIIWYLNLYCIYCCYYVYFLYLFRLLNTNFFLFQCRFCLFLGFLIARIFLLFLVLCFNVGFPFHHSL